MTEVPGAYVTWAYVAERIPSIPWSAIQFGIDAALCDWQLAVGKAEHELAHSSDERLIDLAICTDPWTVRGHCP
jgi:hypothetical protein